MKVGVIGAGAVGAACSMAVIGRGVARELVLVNRTRPRARAVATDLRYGTPLHPRVEVRDGDYDDLAGASVVLITARVLAPVLSREEQEGLRRSAEASRRARV